MSLTKRQAQKEFENQAWKRKNVVYLTCFDCATAYRSGKVGKEDDAFENLRYYEDSRDMVTVRTNRVTGEKEEFLKTNEIITYVENGKTYVLARSGGVSLFDGIHPARKMGKNDRWHCIINANDKSKKLDPALIIEKKTQPNEYGLYHYSIQPNIDMTVEDFLAKLKEFAAYIKRL